MLSILQKKIVISKFNCIFFRSSKEASGDITPVEDESVLSESDISSTLDKITLEWLQNITEKHKFMKKV